LESPDGPGIPLRDSEIPIHKRTDLAADTINGSDRLVVQLIEADDLPPIVAISWPARPTMCNPDRFRDTAAAVARLMASEHRTGQNQVGAVTPLTTEQTSALAISKPGPLLLLTQAGQRAHDL